MKDQVMLCALIMGIILGAVGGVLVGLAFGEPLIFLPGEEKNVWIQVEEREGGSFTIDTATSWIEMSDGTSSVAEASAVISGNRVYAPVDGSSWTTGSEYHLFIHYGTDKTDEVYINGIQIQVKEDFE